jgi:glycosyltransferase involved in cell wall biosynthesis
VIDELNFATGAQRLKSQRDEIRGVWNLPLDSTVFLFAGKFIAKKNPLDYLKALEIACRDGASVVGLMVGDGPLRLACESQVIAAGLPVTFSGFLNQSELLKAYIAADCLVLPSDGGETWGIVVNEAMWSGLPCIVSDRVGCGPDLVAAQGTGEVFPLHDEVALAAAMVNFASNPLLRRESGERARALIQEYSIAAAVEGTVNAVAAVMQGSRS